MHCCRRNGHFPVQEPSIRSSSDVVLGLFAECVKGSNGTEDPFGARKTDPHCRRSSVDIGEILLLLDCEDDSHILSYYDVFWKYSWK
jgi:hypothetical protein